MLKKLLSARVLLPLLLASPMVALGQYGLSLGELLTVIAGAILLLAPGGRSARFPMMMYLYVAVFAMGWLTALDNAASWRITISIGRLSFLYLAGLPFLAYHVGRSSNDDVEQIVTGRVAVAILAVIALLGAAYPFMSPQIRQTLVGPFWVDADLPRISGGDYAGLDIRFPGLGINGNVYAFLVFSVLLFSFNAYLTRGTSKWVPAFAALAIVTLASKLVVVLSVTCCGALWLAKLVADRKTLRTSLRRRGVSPIRAVLYSGAIVIVGTAFRSQLADKVATAREALVVVERFADLVNGGSLSEERSPMEIRLYHWRLGLQRVALAPVRGIAPEPGLFSDTDPLYFQTPHNEFLYLWSAYGLCGLLAHVGLLTYLVVGNLRRHVSLVWILFYLALVAQMFLDGAFEYVRFVALFFLVVGLNFTLWHRMDRSPA